MFFHHAALLALQSTTIPPEPCFFDRQFQTLPNMNPLRFQKVAPMKRWILFLALLGCFAAFILRITQASGGAGENGARISPRAVRIDVQLGLLLERDLPDAFTEGDALDARVVNPAKLMVLGMKGVRKGDRVTLKVLPDGHFQVIRQQREPHSLQLSPQGRIVSTDLR